MMAKRSLPFLLILATVLPVSAGVEAPQPAVVTGETRASGGPHTLYRVGADIRVNYWDPTKIIATTESYPSHDSLTHFYSTDGGVTWGQTALPLAPGTSFQAHATVDWTSDGTAWSTAIGYSPSDMSFRQRVFKSTDNGATWTLDGVDGVISGTAHRAEMARLWVDHSPTSQFKDTLYVIWRTAFEAYIRRRTGPAGSWQPPVQLIGPVYGGGGGVIGLDVKTNSAGDVFVFWVRASNHEIEFVKSTDGGLSFSTPALIATAFTKGVGVPASTNWPLQIWVSSGAHRTPSQNLVYASWSDLTGTPECNNPDHFPRQDVESPCKSRVWFTRSTDGGDTWSAPVMINHQPSLNDQFHPQLAVDEKTGTLAVVYYDTVANAERTKTDLWYQSSFDNGLTWNAPVKVTSAPTDATAMMPHEYEGQYGWHIGLSGIGGQFFPAWTDRRTLVPSETWTAKVTESALFRDGFENGLPGRWAGQAPEEGESP